MFVIRNDPIKYFKAQGIQWYIPNSAAPPFVILRSAATLFFIALYFLDTKFAPVGLKWVH